MSNPFQEMENSDALRMTWNIWPTSRVEATKCVVPFTALYTPNKELENMQVMEYDPVPCKTCGAILNPHVYVDYASKVWTCPMCHGRNSFPSHYHGITPEQMPAELYGACSTIEYKTQYTKPVSPPVYLFVIDTSMVEDELLACKTAVLQAVSSLPEYAQLGLITFGTHVHVHELGFTECAKSYVFKGSKEYSAQQIGDQLGLRNTGRMRGSNPANMQQYTGGRRFILPLSECDFTLQGILEELQRDSWPSVPDHRPAKCTGTALQVAAGLTGAALFTTTCATRIMLFVGGPSTVGGGKIVNTEFSEAIRSHKDLVKEAAPHYKAAKKYYTELAKQLVAQGHSLDIFACSLDQVGLAEMKMPVEATGGLVVQTDTFTNPVFKESMKRVFANPGDSNRLALSSNAIFEVIPVRADGDIKVSGVLGPAAPMEKKSPSVADTQVGMGGTTQWKLASLDPTTTLAVFFEVGGKPKEKDNRPLTLFIQFLTKYIASDGSYRVRVTTVARSWTSDPDPQIMLSAFDQEAAAVVIGRLASHKMEVEDDFDATRWLDRNLIRLASRFGEYVKERPETFQLGAQIGMFPQFMFNLRRSPFVQVFGNSPDETAYCRLALNKESVLESLTAIQPQLLCYKFDQPVQPVLLDVSSIEADCILLLDSYFYVVVFHGLTIAQWKKEGYQDKPEYESFKQLLQAPEEEAASLVQRRFPVPRLVECAQHGSQARFLTAKLNPSNTHSQTTTNSSEVIFTDDVSLAVFAEHLKKLAVQS